MPQGEPGRIRMFNDFIGEEVPVANTATTDKLSGGFRLIGDGIAETDSGLVALESDGLSGVGQLTTTNEDKHAAVIATATMFDLALNGPVIAEARFRLPALANREVYFGFTDVNGDDLSFEDDLVHGGTTTITLTASDLAGFLLSSELTDSADWHTVYNGGSTTGATASGDLDVNDDAVAGEFQIFKLEAMPDGRVNYWIDEVRVGSVAGALSTSTDLAIVCGVESKTTSALTLDVDYILVKANRDWTV